jgi:flavin-dependent dehydrogenase
MRVAIYAGKAMLVAPREQVWGRALGREHLDVMLRDAAFAAGAALFQPAEVTGLERTAEGFLCTLEDGHALTARTVIVACGSWNPKGIFAVPAERARASDLFAFKAHFRDGALPAGLMPLLAFPGGYGGLVQTDQGRTSLSCCIRRDALARARARHGGKAADAVLAHILETTRGARLALEHATLEGHFLSTGPIHPGIRARADHGLYFTGNIAGEAHPVIAEGISMAIQSSGLLARLLVAHRGEAYAPAWKRRFAPRIRAAALFAHLAMGATTRAASLALLRAAPGLVGLGARLSGKLPASA